MAYIVDPTDPTQPTNDKGATQGAGELRALKAYIATLAGLGPTGLGVNVFRKNAIIGGDFDTNPWQRGNAFVGIGVNNVAADRWKYDKNGTMIEDASNTVDAPILGTVYKNKTMDILAIDCLQLNVTTAEAVLAAGDYSRWRQSIEGYNWKLFAQVPIVLSFWHKHTKVGTYCIAIRNSGADRCYIAEYTQAVTETWEYESIAIPASPAAGTWNYTTGVGAEVCFIRGSGATYQTPAGAWTVGNFLASANQVNSLDVIGNKFRIDLVQLEVGTVASKFERRSFQEELILCQRYYEKTLDLATPPAQNAGLGVGAISMRAAVAVASANQATWKFAVRKRNHANIVTYNPLVANASWRDITANADRAAFVDILSEDQVTILMTGVPVVGNQNLIHATADAEL